LSCPVGADGYAVRQAGYACVRGAVQLPGRRERSVVVDERHRARQPVALAEVDPHRLEGGGDLGVLHPFADRAQAHDVADLVDGLDQGALDAVAGHVEHQGAVDLQVVDRQVSQVGEGGEAAAEVVQGEAAALGAQRVDEAHGAVELAQGGGLGDLEADPGGVDAARGNLGGDVGEEAFVGERLGGEVDGED